MPLSIPQTSLRLRIAFTFVGLSLTAVLFFLPAASARMTLGNGAAASAPLDSPVNTEATFNVNDNGDAADLAVGNGICDTNAAAGDQCTLRAAIQEANFSSDTDAITFSLASGTTISLNTALPDISGNLTITGPGSGLLTVMRSAAGGTPNFRIFTINDGQISISGLTVSNGRSADGFAGSGANPGGFGDFGGGIFNAGALTMHDVIVTGNRTGDGGQGTTTGGSSGGRGGFGGGIYVSASGTLTMTNVTVSNNTTGNGGVGFYGGFGGRGGGIYSSGTTLTMTNCVVSGNTAGNGGISTSGTHSGGAGDGGGGDAGGIEAEHSFITPTSTLTLTNVVITDNHAGNAAQQSYGIGGHGGGILTLFGVVTTMENCTISNNNSGQGGTGTFPEGGLGGGIVNHGTMSLIGCTINGNFTKGPSSSGGANGGGIFNFSQLTMTNCTISGNQTDLDVGRGGGIYNHSGGSMTLTSSTITANVSTNTAFEAGRGISSNGTGVIKNTIIAGNATGLDVSGVYTSMGNNLIGSAVSSGSGFTHGSNGDQVGSEASPIVALLGQLANNGGPTQTHALLAGSPALDAGDDSVTGAPLNLSTDQRGAGFLRSVDGPDANTTATVDTGAFEAQVSVEDISDKATNEDTQLQFPFNLGGSASITSVTATSSNTLLVPNNVANIALSGSGSPRTLTINPVANLTGTSTITVIVNGANSQTMTDTFLLTVNAVNDNPSITNNTGTTVNEASTGNGVSSTMLSVSDIDNSAAQLTYTLGTAPANGSLKKGGTSLGAGGTFTQADINNNLVTYDHSGSETTSDSFSFTVSDGAGGSIGSTIFNITVTPTNDNPNLAINTGATITTGATVVIGNSNLLISDPDNTASQLILTLGAAPTRGALKKSGSVLAAGSTFTQDDINNNRITYVHSGITDNSDSFTFTVSDGSGGTIGSTTFSITVSCTANPVVTNTNDSGAGSLRDAILNACSGNTITFNPGLTSGGPATITLTSNELVINKNLTITAPGANLLTVRRSSAAGTPDFRVFNVTSGTVNIQGLTISNGSGDVSGGGIKNLGALTLTNCSISGNTSTVGGGGIVNESQNGTATLTIISSTVSGNTSPSFGAGILNSSGVGTAALNIINSTISGNSGTSFGGGIYNSSTPGPALLNITNSTITGNSAGSTAGGIFNAGNGGTANLSLKNTIVSDNSGPGPGPDVFNFNGTVSGSNNLIETTTGYTISGSNNIHVDPMLEKDGTGEPVLKSNGGPAQTHKLLVASPAINAGSNALALDHNNAALTTDQRGTGFPRLVNSTVDIGAFEANYIVTASSGTPQTAIIGATFAAPLKATVTESAIVQSGIVVMFTPPASGPSGTFQGNVNTATTDASGVATAAAFTANSIAGGPYSVVAGIGANSPTATFSLTNAKIPTSTSLASSLNPSEFGQSVTFTVTVTASGTPTGSVEFFDNGVSLGTVSLSNGTGSLTTSTLTVGSHTITANYGGDGSFETSGGSLTGGQVVNPAPAGGTLSFSSSTFNVTETAGSILITVNRLGDTTQAVTVDYATSDLTADERKDYTPARGTLQFAAGVGARSFPVLVNIDAFTEPGELIQLTLSNQTGGAALGVATSTLQLDNTPWSAPPANSIDHAESFVRQHYHDFLNREPDAAGLAFWANQITECEQPGATCNAEVRRINVSAAFFVSIEFQQTGYLVYRIYKAGHGNISGTPVPLTLDEFLPDTQQIGQGVVVGAPNWEAVLESNKAAFALNFVSRSHFTTDYPTSTTPAQFVDELFLNAGVTPSASDRDAAISEFSGAANTANTAARGRALRRVAENAALSQQEFNRAFVLMQYFGYLRRNPNDAPEPGLNFGGYNFWLGKLNEFGGNYIAAELVKAFISSGEYRQRFGQ